MNEFEQAIVTKQIKNSLKSQESNPTINSKSARVKYEK